MEAAEFTIQNIPAVLYGQASHEVYLFVHGKCGYKEEAKKLEEYYLNLYNNGGEKK